jgi:hypothetical protein
VTVADTVPAGGVAVEYVPHAGVVFQLALTGVVAAPASLPVVAIVTTESRPPTRAKAKAMVTPRVTIPRRGRRFASCASDAPSLACALPSAESAERNEPIEPALPYNVHARGLWLSPAQRLHDFFSREQVKPIAREWQSKVA